MLLRILFFVIFSFCFMLFFMILDQYVGLGLNEKNFEVFITPALTVIYFLIMFPTLRKDFKDRFLVTDELHKAVCYPILLAIFLVFFINGIRFLPMLFGGEIVDVGKGQYTDFESLTTLGEFILISIFPGFTEELMFRYFLYGGIFVGLTHAVGYVGSKTWMGKRGIRVSTLAAIIHVKERLFIEKTPFYIWGWLLITGTLFSLAHLPGVFSFPLYFISGLVNGFFFIKYGFLSAWISHSAFNALSGPAMGIIVNCLMGAGFFNS